MQMKKFAILLVALAVGTAQAWTVTWTGGDMNWTQPDTNSWDATYNSGDTAQFLTSGAGTVNVDASGVTPGGVIVNASANYTFSGGSIGGTGTVTKSGSGALDFGSISNSFSGGVVVNGGSLVNVGANSLGTGTNITFAGTGGIAPKYGGAAVAQGLTVNSGVTATFSFGSSYFSLSFAGPVRGSGTIIIGGDKTGNPLTFSNTTNTFTGTIYSYFTTAWYGMGISVNSLADSANPIRLGATALTLNSGAAVPLIFNGRQIDLVGSAGYGAAIINNNGTFANTITINTPLLITGAGDKTLTLDGTNTGTNLFSGAITNGSGSVISLTKAGAGTWYISGTNTYTGGTTISTGILEICGAGVLGNGAYAGSIANSTTFRYNSTATQTLSGVISGGGVLIKDNIGSLTLTGINTYSGATTIKGGTLWGALGGSCTNSAVTVTNTPGNTVVLGVSVTNNTMQWTCASLAFKTNGAGAQLKFNFEVKSGTTLAPLNVTGNLTFNGAPLVVVSPSFLSPGTYPLVTVGGTVPSEMPALSGVDGVLAWGGSGNRTLSLTVFAKGSVITVR